MFFRSMAERLPGAEPSIRQIDALGHASVVWYVVPAVLTVLGLRHQHPIAPAGVDLALGGVGITMYGGSSLQTHLTAIFISVVVLASILALLVLPPWRRRSTFPAGVVPGHERPSVICSTLHLGSDLRQDPSGRHQ